MMGRRELRIMGAGVKVRNVIENEREVRMSEKEIMREKEN